MLLRRDQERYYKRKGASYENTLSNWITRRVTQITSQSELRKISDRAWDLYENTAIGRGLIEGIVIDTAGTGINPIFSPDEQITGLSDQFFVDYVDTLTTLWDTTAKDSRKFFDAQRRLNLSKLQALAMFLWKMDGIAIFQVLFRDNDFSPSSISLRVIDSYYVHTPTNLSDKNIYDGIRVNADGQPESIFIYSGQEYIEYPLYDKKTGLPLFLLVYDVRNIYEYRQASIMSSMMKTIKDSEETKDAVMVKFLISNLLTIFVENSSFFDLYEDDEERSVNYEDRFVEFEKGTVIHGAKGEEPKVLSGSDQPGPEYQTMVDSVLQDLGIATGRGSEMLKKEFNTSFSAARAALENSDRVDRYDISVLNEQFNNPLVMWFVYDQILRGNLKVPRDLDFVIKNLYAFSRAEWITQPRREIDQLKNSKVDTERLNNGTITYSEIWARQGLRPSEQLKRIVEETKLIDAIEKKEGVDLSFMKRKTVLPSTKEEEEEEEDAT